jgi:hypothetical protein
MVAPKAFRKAALKDFHLVALLVALMVAQKAQHLVPLRVALRVCAFLP